jgi:mRNA interferase RelE/StbE
VFVTSGFRQPYELAVTPPARRAITAKLPPDVAAAAVEYITGPLIENPHRVGKPLPEPLAGSSSARLMRE